MDIKDILQLEESKYLSILVPSGAYDKIDEYVKQYTGDHEVLNRPTKVLEDKSEVVGAKLVVNLQKKIVNASTFFLFGGDIKLNVSSTDGNDLSDAQSEAYRYFQREWNRAKLDRVNRDVARALLSETRAAELYYSVPETKEGGISKFRYRVKVLCKKNGDEIYPYWDDFGDMVAFTRKYKKTVLSDDGKATEIEIIEIYTADIIRKMTSTSAGYEVEDQKNVFGKIPVVYYECEEPDWNSVQTLIDKFEDRLSKFDDTNDYFGSPAVVVKGRIKSQPQKNQIGKLYELSEGADGNFGDVDYLTWDQSPESTKLELDLLYDLVHGITDTPNLTMERLKGVGSYSGVALKILFLASQIKSKELKDLFVESLERRVSLIKTMQSVFVVKMAKLFETMDIEISIGDPLPSDDSMTIEDIITSKEADLMSLRTALNLHPMVEDAASEEERILNERIAGTSQDGL